MNAAAPLAWLIERCDLDCVLVAGRYTLLDDSAADSLLPLCLRRDVAGLAGGVFNGGILAGPDDGAPTTTPRLRPPCWPGRPGTSAPGTASRCRRGFAAASPCATRR